MVTAVQAIAYEEDADRVGVVAGLLSPWSLTNGLASAWDAGVRSSPPPSGAWVAAYVAWRVLVAAVGLAAIVARFLKVGSR